MGEVIICSAKRRHLVGHLEVFHVDITLNISGLRYIHAMDVLVADIEFIAAET